ncbi:MAG: type II toxin-antitoxin system VapC family toxin [Syntrophobacteraceae bacterium]|jgi:predicted nucleic acid-binding protein
MKVMFDTNVYISFIRDRSHSEELQFRGTVKYISAITLMELWAGARIKKAEGLVHRLQKPYVDARRIVTLDAKHYIAMGHFFAGLSRQYGTLVKTAGFVNDVRIAFGAISIGALLYTEDKGHFDVIKNGLRPLNVEYV